MWTPLSSASWLAHNASLSCNTSRAQRSIGSLTESHEVRSYCQSFMETYS